MHDPMLDFLSTIDVTWHSAFIVSTPAPETYAIIGQMDKESIEDLGVYQHVLGYVEGIKEHLLQTLKESSRLPLPSTFPKPAKSATA